MSRHNIAYMAILVLLPVIALGCVAATTAKPKPAYMASAQYQAADWLHNADLAYEAGVYTTAVQYYTKIVESYPDSMEAAKASKRLKELKAKF